MSIRRSMNTLITGSASIINDVSTVSNMRSAIFKRKREILQTPMVRELVHTVFQDNYLPGYLCISASSLVGRVYDRESNTYHPNGVVLYVPEVTFDYEFGCALFLIFQDLYPGVYEMSKVTTNELAEMLNNGTWNVTLTMNSQYMFRELIPAFNIDDAASVPIEQLPVQLQDTKYVEKTSQLPVVSLILGIVCVVVSLFGACFSVIPAIAGIITGIIGLLTTPKKEHAKAIWGVVLSVIGLILIPLIQIVLSFFMFESSLNQFLGI